MSIYIYMAGPFTGWREILEIDVNNDKLNLFNPKDNSQYSISKFVNQDADKITDSDVLLYWESDIGENIGNSAEAGIAHACEIPIIMYSDTGHPHPFIAGMSKRILTEYEQLVKYLNNLKFKDMSVADGALFNNGGKNEG